MRYFALCLVLVLASCGSKPLAYPPDEVLPPPAVEAVVPEATPEPPPAPEPPKPATKQEWKAAGKPCTKDCSGHDAGYTWAQKKGITDPAKCTGKSNSFVEGCRAYAEAN